MQKNKRKSLKRICLCSAIVLVVVVPAAFIIFNDAFSYLLIRVLVFSDVREFKKCQTRLLHETDHQVLVQACRKLSRRVAEGKLSVGRYGVRVDRHPEASRFPREILDLAPIDVSIEVDGSVWLHMFSGLGGGVLVR